MPTLSLLLDIPIPFPSLGSIIPELFLGYDDNENYKREFTDLNINISDFTFSSSTTSSSSNFLANALLLNSLQIMRYFQEYYKNKKNVEIDKLKDFLQEIIEDHYFLLFDKENDFSSCSSCDRNYSDSNNNNNNNNNNNYNNNNNNDNNDNNNNNYNNYNDYDNNIDIDINNNNNNHNNKNVIVNII